MADKQALVSRDNVLVKRPPPPAPASPPRISRSGGPCLAPAHSAWQHWRLACAQAKVVSRSCWLRMLTRGWHVATCGGGWRAQTPINGTFVREGTYPEGSQWARPCPL